MELHPFLNCLPGTYARDELTSYTELKLSNLQTHVKALSTDAPSKPVTLIAKALASIKQLKIPIPPLVLIPLVKKLLKYCLLTSTVSPEAFDVCSLEDINDVSGRFILPLYLRTRLMGVLIELLSKKSTLTSYSNLAPNPTPGLTIDWNVLRKALFLDNKFLMDNGEHPSPEGNDFEIGQQRGLWVQLITHLRRFLPPSSSEEIWKYCERRFRHTNSCSIFLTGVILKLFLPNRAEPSWISARVDDMIQLWPQISHCPDWDTIFLNVITRSRKSMPKDYDYTNLIQIMLSHVQTWLKVPLGGIGGGEGFVTKTTRGRSFISKYKAFCGPKDGIGTIASKFAKLSVFWLGWNPPNSPPSRVSYGTQAFLKLWNYITPYFNPSNLGNWTVGVGILLQYTSRLLTRRVGASLAVDELEGAEKEEANWLPWPIPPHELCLVTEQLLSRSLETVYSKHQGVSQCGDVAIRCLSTMAPKAVITRVLDFVEEGLENVQSVHQAPAVMRLMNKQGQCFWSGDPLAMLQRAPALLDKTLSGLDPCDSQKTIMAISFYCDLLLWFPIGHPVKDTDKLILPKFDASDSEGWRMALEDLDEDSCLRRGWRYRNEVDDDEIRFLMKDVSEVTATWALSFFDRIYVLIKSADPVSKANKSSSGSSAAASRRAEQDRMSAYVIMTVLDRLFSNVHDSVYPSILKSVTAFLGMSACTNAPKQVAYLVSTCAAKNPKLSFEPLFNVISNNLESSSDLIKSYKIRVLSGLVKKAGVCMLPCWDRLTHILEIAKNSDDKKVRKSGNKLLRFCLFSLTSTWKNSYGVSPCFGGLGVAGDVYSLEIDKMWHIPSPPEIDAACELITHYCIGAMGTMKSVIEKGKEGSVDEWRRANKNLEYSLRGCVEILNDEVVGDHPHELHVTRIISTCSPQAQELLKSLRSNLVVFVGECLSRVNTSLEPEFEYQRDPKGATCLLKIIGTLMLERGVKRMGGFSNKRSLRNIKAQKQQTRHTLLKEKADVTLMTKLKFGGTRPLYRTEGKNISAPYLASRALLCFRQQVIDRAGMDIFRVMKCRAEDDGDEACERVLKNYSKVLDGLLGMGCHPYQQCAIASCQMTNSVSQRFGWLMTARVPRLLSIMDLSDESFRDEPFGIPIASDLANDEKGNVRLAELVLGVLINLGANFKYVVNNAETMYDFIKKFTTVAATVTDRLESDKVRVLNMLLNENFEQFRQRFRFNTSPYCNTEEEKVLHLDCISYLVKRLQRPETAPTPTDSANSHVAELHWRNKLMIVWFLMNLLSLDEVEDDELVLTLWKVTIDLVNREDAGLPVQRCGLGLLGRIVTLVNVREGGVSDAVREHVRATMMDETFCKSLVFGLAAAHKEKGGGGRNQGSPGVTSVLKDASKWCGGQQVFPSLRDSLVSYSYKLKHSMLIAGLLNLLPNQPSGLESAVHLLKYSKELAESPPSEDQKNFHTGAAEVFGGVCKGLIGTFKGIVNAEAAWNLLTPFLSDVLENIYRAAVEDWADGIRYGIHRAGVGSSKPVLDLIMGKGFASQAKWMKLMGAIFIELSYVEPENEEGLAGEFENAMTIDGDGEISAETIWEDLRSILLPRLLDAVNHPFNSCRSQVAESLLALSGITSGHKVLNLHSNMDAICSRFRNVLLDPSLETERKRRGKETICMFFINCIHLGDVVNYYGSAIIPLLDLAFKTLGDFESEEGGTEASTARLCRQCIGVISSRCILGYLNERDEHANAAIEIVGECSQHPSWQVRQAASVFFSQFYGVNKFLLSEDQGKKIFKIFCHLLGDERREVCVSATSGVVGMLAIMGEEGVGGLVEEYILLANKSVKKSKKRGGVVKEEEEVKKMERERQQRISVSVLCAAVHSSPYSLPFYVPPAIASLSKHSFESSAPLGVRELVVKTLSDFKRTHVDGWAGFRLRFKREEMECLDDVVTCSYYA
ncbi:hypothetical protein TL16_g02356 [Triparma laevis f. inornata]|uniref:Proteasome activator subunit 4 n=1 Tax=Triparma laevis f. inornata TaxID=1714386 RepID=A0A9W6ZMZ8_9STRA|nr:hypothetical protein TL16_g02356 [Triparma laevis f. inornata]